MRTLPEAFAPTGLALALACGLLHGQEGRVPANPRSQGEAQPAPVLLQPRNLAPLNMDCTRGVKVAEVLMNLAKHSGVSIILHASASAQDLTTTADLRGMGFQRVLDTLMLQNDLFYKVMDPTAIMVFKKTPQNLHEFETRTLKTFYLANAEVESVRQTFNALMPQLRVMIDKRLNALTVACTPLELASTQQIVNNLDRARGEVRLQMELLDVAQKVSVAAGILGLASAPDGKAMAQDQALAAVKQAPDSRLMASPDLRVASGETAEIRLGAKTAAAPAVAGPRTGKAGPATQPQGPGPGTPSDELGVRIRVKPRLRADHEITLDLVYELTDPGTGEPGRPGLSERVIKTTLRLKEGEIAVFGGLLGNDAQEGRAAGATGAQGKRDRILVVKAVALRWDAPAGPGTPEGAGLPQ